MKSSSGRISFKSSMWVMMLYIPFSLIFILVEPLTLEKGDIPCLLHTFYIDFKIPSTMGTSSHLGRALPHSLNSLNSLFFRMTCSQSFLLKSLTMVMSFCLFRQWHASFLSAVMSAPICLCILRTVGPSSLSSIDEGCPYHLNTFTSKVMEVFRPLSLNLMTHA